MKINWRHYSTPQYPPMRNLQFTDNGITLSLSLGSGSWSDGGRRWWGKTSDSCWENTTAEIAIVSDGNLAEMHGDTVAGNVPLSKLANLLQILSFPANSLTKDERIKLMVDCIQNKED